MTFNFGWITKITKIKSNLKSEIIETMINKVDYENSKILIMQNNITL